MLAFGLHMHARMHWPVQQYTRMHIHMHHTQNMKPRARSWTLHKNYGYLSLVFIMCTWWGVRVSAGIYEGQKRALHSSPGAGGTSSWEPHGEGAGNQMGVFCKSSMRSSPLSISLAPRN